MGFFRDYKYSTTQVTAICTDTNNGNFVWVAFAASGGNCTLLKVSATDLSQVYYTVSVPVTSINAMKVINGYVFLAVTHATIFSIAYSVTNPLTTFVTLNKPAGVSESPIAITSASAVYFLTPGSNPGTYATIVQTTNLNIFTQSIVLNQNSVFVNGATSIAIDGSSNLWVLTSGTPSFLVRVFPESGGGFGTTLTALI